MYNCQTVPKNQGVTHVTEPTSSSSRAFNQVQHCFIILGNTDEWTQEPLHTAPETTHKIEKITNMKIFKQVQEKHQQQ